MWGRDLSLFFCWVLPPFKPQEFFPSLNREISIRKTGTGETQTFAFLVKIRHFFFILRGWLCKTSIRLWSTKSKLHGDVPQYHIQWGRRLEGWPNTAAPRLASLRRVTQQGWFCPWWTVRAACPAWITPIAPVWAWSITKCTQNTVIRKLYNGAMPSLAGGECPTGVIVLSREGLLSCELWQLQLLLLLMVYYSTYTVNRQHFNHTFPEESGYSKTHAVTLITPPPLQRHKCFSLSFFMATPEPWKK